MAATVKTVSQSTPLSSRVFRLVDVTADNAYPTGGYALTAAMFGLSRVDMVLVQPGSGHQVVYDHANAKLKFFHGDNTNAAAAPGVELANTASGANGVVIRLLVIGE